MPPFLFRLGAKQLNAYTRAADAEKNAEKNAEKEKDVFFAPGIYIERYKVVHGTITAVVSRYKSPEGSARGNVGAVAGGWREWAQEKTDAVKHSAGSVIRLRKSGEPALPCYQVTALPSCPGYICVRVTVCDRDSVLLLPAARKFHGFGGSLRFWFHRGYSSDGRRRVSFAAAITRERRCFPKPSRVDEARRLIS